MHKILLVEDNEINRDMLTRRLQRHVLELRRRFRDTAAKCRTTRVPNHNSE